MARRQERLRELVVSFVDAINRYDTAEVVAMTSDDVHVSFAGLTPFEGHERVRAYFDWFAGLRAMWDLEIRDILDGDVVRCRLTAHDRWSEIAGISPLEYSRVDITIENELITRVETEFTPETNRRLSSLLEAFTPWATHAHPELYTDDGDYAYYLDAGARMVDAMEEWKALITP